VRPRPSRSPDTLSVTAPPDGDPSDSHCATTLRIGDQPTEVTCRALVASGLRDRKQLLGRNPSFRLRHAFSDQLGHRVVIVTALGSRWRRDPGLVSIELIDDRFDSAVPGDRRSVNSASLAAMLTTSGKQTPRVSYSRPYSAPRTTTDPLETQQLTTHDVGGEMEIVLADEPQVGDGATSDQHDVKVGNG
jgi:hypothetical protein